MNKKATSRIGKFSTSNKKLLIGVLLALISATVVIYVIRVASGVHFPFLIAAIGAVIIGFTDSRRGWWIAIIQSVLILSGIFFAADWISGVNRELPELEIYGALGAVAMTFTGSFIGAFMKRALDSN